MHPIILQIVALTSTIFGGTALTQEDALSAAQRAAVEGGVKVEEFEITKTHKELNGGWSFLYECKSRETDCHFLVLVNGNTGHVTVTSEVDIPVPEGIPESIQEAAFASEIVRRKSFVACLEVEGSSASKELIDKLNRLGASVVDTSECEAVTDVERGSYHKPTGRSAIFYTLSALHRSGASHATIKVNSYHHGLDAEGITLFLELKAAKWTVVKRQTNWVS